MDITSYLLGKKASGGGGGDLDWSAIGYSGEPQLIVNGYNHAVQIKNEWTPAQDLRQKFYKDYNMVFMPLVDTSSATDMQNMFQFCTRLLVMPLLNTSSATNMQGFCRDCPALKSIPQIDTSSATNMSHMFNGNKSLEDVPQLNTSSATTMQNAFSSCANLTDTSLDNILKMCINVNSNYIRIKTLNDIGFTNANYSASRIQALPHYQDFIDAGWTIGY